MVKQLKIVLGEDLRRKLDEASARSGKSVAEEIRSRVEATFKVETKIEEAFGRMEAHLASERERRKAELEALKREVEQEADEEIGALDLKTLTLLDYALRIAKEVERETGNLWHEHPGVGHVFIAALTIRAVRLGAGGEASAFEIQAAPFRGKKIMTTADMDEHAQMLEQIDLSTWPLERFLGPPKEEDPSDDQITAPKP